MRILILEDNMERMKLFLRKFRSNIIDHTDDANEAIELLKNHKYDLICLDHDLGGKQMEWDEDNCGMVVADWLKNNPLGYHAKVIIHSFNQPAALRMKEALPAADYIPGYWMY